MRNTSDGNGFISPAEIIYRHQLKSIFAILNKLNKFTKLKVRPMRKKALKLKEETLQTRYLKSARTMREFEKYGTFNLFANVY